MKNKLIYFIPFIPIFGALFVLMHAFNTSKDRYELCTDDKDWAIVVTIVQFISIILVLIQLGKFND